MLPDVIHLPQDISRLVNEVYNEGFSLQEVPEGYERAREADKIKENKLRQDAASFRICNPDDEFSKMLEVTVPPDDEHARAQVRAGDMSLDAILMVRNPCGSLSLLPWLSNGEEWMTNCCPSFEDARRLASQRINLNAGLLRTMEYEMSFNELLEILAIPASWKESVWLRQTHLLILDHHLCAEVGNLALTYDEKRGLEWKRRGDCM